MILSIKKRVILYVDSFLNGMRLMNRLRLMNRMRLINIDINIRLNKMISLFSFGLVR